VLLSLSIGQLLHGWRGLLGSDDIKLQQLLNLGSGQIVEI
jgi:hypothetical protein